MSFSRQTRRQPLFTSLSSHSGRQKAMALLTRGKEADNTSEHLLISGPLLFRSKTMNERERKREREKAQTSEVNGNLAAARLAIQTFSTVCITLALNINLAKTFELNHRRVAKVIKYV